ncbi:MAG: protein kinase [Pyrinomonadaceae bacterium]
MDQVCGTDPELRREIETLLFFDDTSDGFMDSFPDSLIAEIFEQKEDLCGQTIDRYKIISLLGKGGMGAVYLAQDTSLNRKIALKFLHQEFGFDPEKLKRFTREARATSVLNHPNILTVYEIGNFGATNYIATEYIEGKTLREAISSNTPPPAAAEVIKIAVQVSEALAQAHKAGIIHRDIKPENIMIRPDGYVKVLDFGLAKLFESNADLFDEKSLSLSTPGLIKGTISYMSPEQARGQKVDKRTDIWSFGVMLYELFTGRLPFSGETPADVLTSIIHLEPPALNHFKPEMPDGLTSLINKMLQKDPAARYSGFEEILADLEFEKNSFEDGRFEKAPLTDLREDFETVILDPTSKSWDGANPKNNLSGEISPLIGRTNEIKQISELLKKTQTRLLSLTGIGGTGKTRVAKSIAKTLLNNFPDGVFFIDLSMIDDPDFVLPFIAKTLELKAENDKTEKETLKEVLREKKVLLVLDNFEQVIEAAPAVGELILSAENLKVLVTSRVRLQLSFENEFVIQPLEFPAGNSLNLGEMSHYPAVKLFVERARSANSRFALNDDNLEPVAEICRKLDGLPLAIELAAARIKFLAPVALLRRLEKSLKLLTGGAKDLPERQQTMRQAISWSYDLLDEAEKTLFKYVSVFRGGFTIESAEAILSPVGDPDLDVFEGLASLVDKSLIVQREQTDGEPRFRMLEVVREFALEKLGGAGETDKVKQCQAEFFANLAGVAEPEFEGKNSGEWFEKIEREHDNFRSSLKWALNNNPETALRIVSNLRNYWMNRGFLVEGEEWTQNALENEKATNDQNLLARANFCLGDLSWNRGKFSSAEIYYKKSLEISLKINDKTVVANSCRGLAYANYMQGDLKQAENLFERGLEVSKEIGDQLGVSKITNGLGEIARLQKNYDKAQKYYEESLSVARRESLNSSIQIACINLAAVACIREDYQTARSYTVETLELSRKTGNKLCVGYAFERFIALAVIEGEMEKAALLNGAMETIYDNAGYLIEDADRIFLESYTDQAKSELGEEFFEKAKNTGRAMPLEDAVILALGDRH